MASLMLSASPQSKFLRFVAAAVSSKVKIEKTGAAAAAGLRLASGEVLEAATASNSIAKYIASQAPNATQWLGSSPLERAEVSSWVSFSLGQGVGAAKFGVAGVEAWLTRLEGAVSTRSYLVGSAISLADIAVFYRSYPYFSSLPPSRRMAAPVAELGRWFDQIQHQTAAAGAAAALSVLCIERGVPAAAEPAAKGCVNSEGNLHQLSSCCPPN